MESNLRLKRLVYPEKKVHHFVHLWNKNEDICNDMCEISVPLLKE